MPPTSLLSRLPKGRVYILSTVLLLAVILVGFAYIYGQAIDEAPLQDGAYFSQAALLFYLITMPTITIIHTIAEFLFYIFSCSWWTARAQLIVSVLFAMGWFTQACFWVDCEVMLPKNNSIAGYCPQSPLKNGGTDRYGGEAITKNVVIWIAFVLYFINTMMSWISFHYARRMKAPLEPEADGEQFANF